MLGQLIKGTFFNNGLSVLVTVAALAFGAYEAHNQYESWQAQRTADKQTTAIVERCANDATARNEIEAEANDAIINDSDNSFINQ